MPSVYQISAVELRELRAQAERHSQLRQREVCGLLLSENDTRLRLAFLSNQASRPGGFLIKKSEYHAAARRAKSQGAKVLGTFHSHPVSEAIPGAGDIRNAASGSLMLIYDVCGREAKLWEIQAFRGRREAKELTFSIQESTVWSKSETPRRL